MATVGPRAFGARVCQSVLGAEPEAERPATAMPGGPGRREALMLLADAVGPFSTLGLEGLDVVPGLLHRAGHEPADSVFLPAHLVHDLRKRGAVLPLKHRY